MNPKRLSKLYDEVSWTADFTSILLLMLMVARVAIGQLEEHHVLLFGVEEIQWAVIQLMCFPFAILTICVAAIFSLRPRVEAREFAQIMLQKQLESGALRIADLDLQIEALHNVDWSHINGPTDLFVCKDASVTVAHLLWTKGEEATREFLVTSRREAAANFERLYEEGRQGQFHLRRPIPELWSAPTPAWPTYLRQDHPLWRPERVD